MESRSWNPTSVLLIRKKNSIPRARNITEWSLTKLDEMKEYDPEQMRKLHQLKVKVEVICEASDLKRITDLLKELAKK